MSNYSNQEILGKEDGYTFLFTKGPKLKYWDK